MSPIKVIETVVEKIHGTDDLFQSTVLPEEIIPKGRSETFILGTDPNRYRIVVHGHGLITRDVPIPGTRNTKGEPVIFLNPGETTTLSDKVGNRLDLEYLP